MKKAIAIMIILIFSFIFLSGCNKIFPQKKLPSDEWCIYKIKEQMNKDPPRTKNGKLLWDESDEIFLKNWDSAGYLRVFEWCHYTGGDTGTYCGRGYIDIEGKVYGYKEI